LQEKSKFTLLQIILKSATKEETYNPFLAKNFLMTLNAELVCFDLFWKQNNNLSVKL